MREPYESGMLDVGGGHRVYREICGDPVGRPAAVVHGGADLSSPLDTAWELSRA
ncbi:hypothetical protein ACGRHY_15695 [Streptomyces sp. HK10]|uniref:hypothetical protein n=1 Tax=Streptomyces sp. HK10 TaxID=3373255 RepID=UPI0037479860